MKKNFLFASLLFCAALSAQNTIDNGFFEKVKFRGAFGTTDWTSGWSNFDPQNTAYPATSTTIEAGHITTNMALGSPFNAPSSFADASLASSFFTAVDYIGAFGQTDWTAGWANFDPQNTAYGAATVTVEAGNITTNTTWTKNNVYLLNGWVYVKDGATLTIEAGTVIRGDKTNKGALIIEKGAKLLANGTVAEPIVFTSNQAAGSRTYGDWGGLILLGKAPLNTAGSTATIEGGVGSTYGGTDAADNSGSLQYVRIEFPGIAFVANSEINGLTMGGVGSATTIDNIQVSYSGDDSFEWFGGTVNAKHLIALRGWDDDFDTDYGYSGMVQFGVSLRDPAVADQSKSNCFESDNDGSGSINEPFTSPVFSNMSSYGPKVTASTTINALYQSAMHLRRNSKIKIFNSIFAGWPSGVQIDGIKAQESATTGNLKLKNVVISGMGTNFVVPANPVAPAAATQTWDVAAETAWFATAGFNNATFANNTSLLVNDPFNLTAPNFKPFNSYLLNGWAYVNDGVTLTVNPGVVVRGDKTNKGALIVEKGGKLIANGTLAQPIVFTSNQAAGSRTYGDWGGVILCGKAPINPAGGSATIEGGVGSTYGGTDAADNSGSLQYVRIEFPGIAFVTNSEINGLTMGGVGSGTTIDNIQVSYSGDDSFEWFGGTVNAKHLIALRGWDDDFDTDYGYSGMVQYAVALRDPAVADQSKSNSFESDNDASGTINSPFTSAVFSNVSSFGPKVTSATTINALFQSAMHLRRNTNLKIYNSVFAGWPSGLQVDGIKAQANASSGNLKLQNTVIAGMGSNFVVPANPVPPAAATQTWDVTAERTWFNDYNFKNDTTVTNDELNITNPFNLTAPNFLPTAKSKLQDQSSWFFMPTEGLANNMNLYVKAFANGSQVTALGSTLMAYKNGECRGSDEILPDGTFMLLAMSDLATESDLELKLYDRASRKIYNLPTVFDFEDNADIASYSVPATVTATGSLSIPLIKGTNWISFNVLPEASVTTKNVLNYTPTTGDVVSRQGGSTASYAGGNWIGTLSDISKDKMYKLKCKGTTPGSINVVNQPLVVNSAITLTTGINWIGYSLVESATVSTVLSGYAATSGDKITTNAGGGQTATYGATWISTKPTLIPGRGYSLKSINGGLLTFPRRVLSNTTPNRVSESEFTKNSVANTKTAIWSEPQGKANNMTIYARVAKPDGTEYMPEGLILGVFKGTDNYCYGVTPWVYDEAVGYIFLFGAQSDATKEDGYFFKVFDTNTNTFYNSIEIPATYDDGVANDDKFEFVSDAEMGEIFVPVILKIKDMGTDIDQVEKSNFMVYNNQSDKSLMIAFDANNMNVDVTICDVQGRIVKQLINENVKGGQKLTYEYSQLGSGLYIVKANIGGKVHTQKVILN